MVGLRCGQRAAPSERLHGDGSASGPRQYPGQPPMSKRRGDSARPGCRGAGGGADRGASARDRRGPPPAQREGARRVHLRRRAGHRARPDLLAGRRRRWITPTPHRGAMCRTRRPLDFCSTPGSVRGSSIWPRGGSPSTPPSSTTSCPIWRTLPTRPRDDDHSRPRHSSRHGPAEPRPRLAGLGQAGVGVDQRVCWLAAADGASSRELCELVLRRDRVHEGLGWTARTVRPQGGRTGGRGRSRAIGR
jgi:hypothetical protein